MSFFGKNYILIQSRWLLGGVFITWRQKDRKPSELGLYGKNAFYTSETDDVFLVGEAKRMSNGNNNTNGKVQKGMLKEISESSVPIRHTF